MPNASELARMEEEAKIEVNELPAQFLKWKKAAYPLSKKAMDEEYYRRIEVEPNV